MYGMWAHAPSEASPPSVSANKSHLLPHSNNSVTNILYTGKYHTSTVQPSSLCSSGHIIKTINTVTPNHSRRWAINTEPPTVLDCTLSDRLTLLELLTLYGRWPQHPEQTDCTPYCISLIQVTVVFGPVLYTRQKQPRWIHALLKLAI